MSPSAPSANSADRAGSLAGRLAAFVADLRYDALPEAVRQAARHVLLDTLGAALAGTLSDEARLVREVLQDYDHTQEARIWGTARRASRPGAAFANGTSTHAFEMDDFGGCDHSGAVVIPAVLALAEGTARTGRDVVTAVVAGYDIAHRVMDGGGGYWGHNARGWHSTGTCGTFGAAAAAAQILGLNWQHTVQALGIAGSFTGGLWAFNADGAMTKRLHPGKAAEAGVVAALLARRGVTGPAYILEADYGGFYPTYLSRPPDVDRLLGGLGEDFRILRTGFKPYASCRGVHGAIDVILDLRKQKGLRPEDVRQVTVWLSEANARMVGNQEIRSLLDAQMSLPYGVAVSLLEGDASLAQYRPERWRAPRLRDMMARIHIEVDEGASPEDPAHVQVATTEGHTLEGAVRFARGAPENPLSDDELRAKFRGLAGSVLPEQQVRRLEEVIMQVDRLDRLDDLCLNLVAP